MRCKGELSMQPEQARGFARSVLTALGSLGVCLLFSGCGGTNAEPAPPAELEALKAAAIAAPVLAAGETINVIVYGETSLTGKYLIDPSGYVSLPLAGTIKAAGLTPEQLGHD